MMKLIMIIIAYLSFGHTSQSKNSLYRRLNLDANQWTKFVHKTIGFEVATKIECGSACNYLNDQCNMFIHIEEKCHVGNSNLDNQNHLNGLTGTHALYLEMDKMTNDWETTFTELNFIKDESHWKTHIFRKADLPQPADVLECSFLCKNVERQNGCDLFLMEDQICYLGKSSYSGSGDVDLVENGTIFLTTSSLDAITIEVGTIPDLPFAKWNNLTVHEHEESVESLKHCQGIAVEEKWQFVIYEASQQKCFFGMLEPETNLILEDDIAREFSVNSNELKDFVSNKFVTRQSNIYSPYPYVRINNAKSPEHCSMVCFFDVEERCDFFFIHGSYCYLGNFNQESAIGSSGDWITTYIYKNEVGDMLEKLFPLSLQIGLNRLTRRLRERFAVVSELECGAHAALANGPIDYFIYLNGECLLGDIPHGSSSFGDGTIHDIRLRIGNTQSDVSSRFNEHFILSNYIWTKYIFQTYVLQTEHHHAECGLQCELSIDHCDFFATASGNCYLGRYSHWASGNVADASEPMTYHKSGWSSPYIYDPNYRTYGTANWWANYVYKYIYRHNWRKCHFECHHDSSCDFFVNAHTHCFYGSFSYTGTKLGSWTDLTTLYFKNSELENPVNLEKGRLLAILPKWGKFFQVEADITITKFSSTWISIFHFTRSNNNLKYVGDRQPMIKIYKDDYFHICSGINSNMNWCQNYGGIKLNTKYHIVIQQYPYHSHAYYRILVNGAVFKGVENKSPKDYSSVYVYASNPWYTSFKNYGKLENFKFRYW